MKKLLTLIFLLVPALAFAQGSPVNSVSLKPVCFAQLTNKPSQADGTVAFCKNCTQTTTCASSGACLPGATGALAIRLNGAWNCNSGAGGASSVTGLTNPLIADVTGNAHAVDNISLTNSTVVNSSVNGVLNIMAKPYLAKGDGSTDDLAAIQQAIWDASTGGVPFGACASGPHAAVYVPKPAVCFAHSAPIRVTCPNVNFGGATGEKPKLCNLNYRGKSLIQNGYGATLPYDTSLVTGPGHSLVTASGVLPQIIDLATDLNGLANLHGINTWFNNGNGFAISFYDKVTSGTGGRILESTAAYPAVNAGAFTFFFDGSNRVTTSINTTGGTHTFAVCAAQVTGTVYQVKLDWDKTTYRVWQGVPGGTASLCDSWASGNGLKMGIFEDIMLPDGGRFSFWPEGGNNIDNSFIGRLDSIVFDAKSENTAAYTVPTTKTPDPVGGGSFALDVLNFETSIDGTQIAATGQGVGTTPATLTYFTVLYGAPAIGSTSGDYIHDLELCSQDGSGSSYGRITDGLYANVGDGSTWDNLWCSNSDYGAFTFAGNDFFATLKNSHQAGPSHYGFMFGPAWNNSISEYNSADNVDGACEINQGGGGGYHISSFDKCTDRGGLTYGLISNQSSGIYTDFYMDQEGANTAMIAGALLNAPQNTTVFEGGLIGPGTTGVHVVQDNPGQGSLFKGTIFQNFGAPAELIDFTNGAPLTATLLSATINPPSVPFANAGFQGWIKQPGIDPVYKYTVAASTALILPAIGDSKHIITLNSSSPLVLPAGLAQAGPNFTSQFLKAYVCYAGSRTVADGVTNTTTTITSATLAFTNADIGRVVTGSADLPANDKIASVTNGTTAVLTNAATGSHSGQTFTLNNFVPGWTNGVGNAVHGSLPTSTATGNVCDVYNWDYRDPGNVFLDSYTLGLPG